jgi:3-oxoacyl-[acyl-carrier protein] reductase
VGEPADDAASVGAQYRVQAFFAAAERALGAVTIAVANAGIYPNCPVLDMTVEEWDRVMETNMRGVFLTCQAAARSMKAGARAGKIITISSGAYASGRVGALHYCASKAGVVMFTRVLAMELAEQRINVNCIAPGYIKVDSGPSSPSSDFETSLTRNTPWGGWARRRTSRRLRCSWPHRRPTT